MNPHAYAQKKDGWCGPAAMQYALSQQGKEVSQEVLARRSNTTTEGLDQKPLEHLAKQYGAETVVSQGKDPAATLLLLQAYRNMGWSVILDYMAGDEVKEDGHYIVLEKVNRDSLTVFDPSNGGSIKDISKEYFINHWKDVDEDGKTLKNYALMMILSEPYE